MENKREAGRSAPALWKTGGESALRALNPLGDGPGRPDPGGPRLGQPPGDPGPVACGEEVGQGGLQMGGELQPGGVELDLRPIEEGVVVGGAWGQQRRGQAAYNPENGANVVVDIKLDAKEAKDGARKTVRYTRFDTCGHCGGSGSVSSEHAHTCPSCGGRGHIDVDLSFLFGAGTFQSVCPECGGSGKVVAGPCPDCGGSGRTRVTSEQTIEFPAGTHDGDEVRISGMGHAGTNGAAGGDLVGRAHVESERLEGKARTGFYLMGIVAPFLVLSAISGVFSAFAVMCFIPFTMGLFMVLSDGVLHRSLLWWKRGAMQFANGFANGFMFALVSVWFASCSQRAMLSPYGMQ